MKFLNTAFSFFFVVNFDDVSFGEAAPAALGPILITDTILLESDDLITQSVGDFFPFLKFKEYGDGRALGESNVQVSDCFKEDYQVVFVGYGQHFVIAAKLECDVCKCPSTLVFHQDSMLEENSVTSVKKQILEVPEGVLDEHDSLSLGSFSLGKIVESFDEARSGLKVYDFITNNCASLIIEMFLSLGIDPTDKSIVTYAANHLFGNANSNMMDGLSQNDFRLGLEKHNSNSYDDQYTIIEDFVKTYIG